MESRQVRAVFKARDLSLLALENADSAPLQQLIRLQDPIKNLNFVRGSFMNCDHCGKETRFTS